VLTNRAYSLLDIKAIDEDERIVTGIASTAEPDRMGDIVEPKGAEFKLPIPFLWQHNAREPIGEVFAAKVTKNGIEIKARIAKITEPGALKDRIDEAWQSLKAGLVKGLSIGFQPIESARIDNTYGLRFIKWLWLELSAVTIAANGGAFVSSIKSIADLDRAALGTGPVGVTSTSAGVSAPVVKASKGAGKMKTYTERINEFVQKRAASQARRDEIQTKASEEGRSKDEKEREEFDTLSLEIKGIDDELVDLRVMEAEQKAAAVPVNGQNGKDAAASRGGSVITVKSNLPPGTGFTRYAMALAAGRGSRLEAAEYAKRWEKSTPEVAMILKAAVTAGTTTDSDWAAPLVVYQNLAGEFVELLRPETIIGKLIGLRNVPFNVTMPNQTQGGTYGWVGQGKPKPVGELKFGQLSLGMAKAAGIIVLSEELVRSSSPSAEGIVRADMIAGMAAFLDVSFVDPSVAEVANVSPAAITNGITPVDSTGITAAAFRLDFKTLVSGMIAAGITNLSGAHWIMTQTQALAFSLMRTSLDAPEFPGITMNGGTLLGLPVVASEAVPAEGGSPAGSRIILVLPREILLADDGGVSIDVSREASLQMNTTPDDPASASTVMISLWQNNLVGLRAERFINWKRRRDAAVGIIEGALYTG
jgi:HK97 family phage major capsid protein/HK97 family phage prohead protease